MLVLTFRPGDRAIIGGNIVVTFLRPSGGNGVRLGIDAPREIGITRPDVLRRAAAMAERGEHPEQAAFEAMRDVDG